MRKYNMKICEFCKKGFIPSGEYRNRNRKFCSRECYRNSINTDITLRCINCEKRFTVRGKYKNRKFCSSDCVSAYRKKTGETQRIPCQHCGKMVERYKYQQRKTKQVFCSSGCISEYKQKIAITSEDYFERIDTPQKAYILGLFASDGSVSDDNKINLTMNDLDAVEFVVGELGYNNKISTINPKSENHNTSYSINIKNDKMGNDLKALNILPRKSLMGELDVPQIDAELDKYFWSGFMDGDGSVYVKDEKYTRLSAVSKSKKYVERFSEFLKKYSINSSVYRSRNVWTISFGGKSTAKQIYELLFNRDFGMKRKQWKLKNYVDNM